MEQQRVLVIEDDPYSRETLRDLLSVEGYAVTAIDSVFGAAALLRRLQPCAVLLSLELPYRSGASLLKKLKADPRYADIQVIILSNLPTVLPPDQQAMAAAIVTKPFEPPVVLHAVQAACASTTAPPPGLPAYPCSR